MDFNSMGGAGLPKPRLSIKVGLVLLLWLGLEFGAFWGVWQLLGINSWWVIGGFFVVGLIVNPAKPSRPIPSSIEELDCPPPMPELPKNYLSRKLAAVFFMIPTFMTDILAILMLITPVRRSIQRYVLSKFLPKDVANLIADGSSLQDMMKNSMNGAAGTTNPQSLFGQNKTRRGKYTSNEVIDIETEDDDKKSNVTEVKIEREEKPYGSNRRKATKALTAEIIDIDSE